MTRVSKSPAGLSSPSETFLFGVFFDGGALVFLTSFLESVRLAFSLISAWLAARGSPGIAWIVSEFGRTGVRFEPAGLRTPRVLARTSAKKAGTNICSMSHPLGRLTEEALFFQRLVPAARAGYQSPGNCWIARTGVRFESPRGRTATCGAVSSRVSSTGQTEG